MLGKIWERYFVQEFLRMVFLFLFCFFGLYVLIDYASHASALARHPVDWVETIQYYFYVLAARAEILLPLALLIAFVHTVCTMNTRQELVALMASGIQVKTLMRPFLLIGLFCMLLMYANEEFLLPPALKKLRRIEDATKHQRKRPHLAVTVHHIILDDGSLLLYQDYDTALEQFFDLHWIKSIDEIYRIKSLSPYLSPPQGHFVDHLKREANGELLQTVSHEEQSFPEMRFNPELLQSAIVDPETYSITELVQQAETGAELSEKGSKVWTALYWKLAIPWLCLLAIIAPTPFCVRFSRQLPVFLIYVCTLFGLIAFYMFIDAAQVIAIRQILPPFWALLSPFFAAFAVFGWRYAQL